MYYRLYSSRNYDLAQKNKEKQLMNETPSSSYTPKQAGIQRHVWCTSFWQWLMVSLTCYLQAKENTFLSFQSLWWSAIVYITTLVRI